MSQNKNKTKISHSLQQLQDGAILTIQDKPVLMNGQINQDDDVFQDQQKQRQNQTKHNKELKAKLATVSSAITSHVEVMNQGKKKLLPHYDDYRYKSEQIEIQDGQIIKRNRPKLQQKVANDFQFVGANNVNKEYYDRNIKFKNRKNQSSKTVDILNFLNETAVEKNTDDTQNSNADDLINESLNTIRKRKKIQNEAVSNQIKQNNQDEQLLRKAINLGRRRNLQQNKILNIIKEEQQDQLTQQHNHKKYTQIEMNLLNHKQSNSGADKKTYNIVDAAKGTTSCLFVNLPSQKIILKKQENQMPISFKNLTPQQLEKMKQQISFLQEKQAGIGLSGTLEYLRKNKLINNKQQFGKSNDQQTDFNKPQDRVKIQYINASGKQMTPKEAFRYLSAKFHGHGPGKNKVQKMMKRQITQMKIKQAANGPSKLMNLLQKHQGKTGQAHLVIQLGSKSREQ